MSKHIAERPSLRTFGRSSAIPRLTIVPNASSGAHAQAAKEDPPVLVKKGHLQRQFSERARRGAGGKNHVQTGTQYFEHAHGLVGQGARLEMRPNTDCGRLRRSES